MDLTQKFRDLSGVGAQASESQAKFRRINYSDKEFLSRPNMNILIQIDPY